MPGSCFSLGVGHPTPVACIRTSTERLEALDKGRFALSGIDEVGLLQSVDLAFEMVRNGDLGAAALFAQADAHNVEAQAAWQGGALEVSERELPNIIMGRREVLSPAEALLQLATWVSMR